LSERVLTLKNEAVLHEVSASDPWAEYQAQSVKSHLYDISAKTHPGPLSASLQAQAARYKAEQPPLRDQARRHEAARDHDLLESTQLEQRKAGIDVAVALFEIAIVLTSIVALTRRPWLLALAAAGGLVAAFFSLRGVFGG
jgi:hypothetical protein